MTIILGIAGASSSGKSSLANSVAQTIGGRLICLDDYWIKGVHRPLVSGAPSFERPEQYDGDRMAADIENLVSTNPNAPVVAEGFLLFLWPSLSKLCTHKFFLSVPHEVLRERRIGRGRKVGSVGVDPWLINGEEEWAAFGAQQEFLDGVTKLDGIKNINDNAHRILEELSLSGPNLTPERH